MKRGTATKKFRVHFRFTADSFRILCRLAKRCGCNRTEAVERAIRLAEEAA